MYLFVMSPSRLARLACAAAAIVVLALTHTGTVTSAAIQLAGAEVAQIVAQPASPPGRVQVLIELREEPAAAIFARVLEDAAAVTPTVRQAAAAAGRAQAQRVVGQQAQMTSAIAASGIATTEIFRVQKAMNAIAAEIDGGSIVTLRRLPGVKAVHVLELEYPTNGSSVPFIGAPAVWANTLGLPAGATGTGVRIGVIDTGIDYLHATFGGSGLLTDYTTNNRTIAPDAYFPNAKVVGGTDFAGDTYNGTAGTIAADPDPMDCNGHGTHVAGTAAGYGVNADGTTFAGPFGPTTPFASLRVGPGSAPQAQLYGLRVFGCGGGTNLTIQAIDWATDPNGDSDMSDRLDVINMSLGSPLGSLSSTTAIAAENAAAIGIIVVASAGNNGDTYFVGGSPGVSTRTLSVASSVDSGVGGSALRVNTPPGIAGFQTTNIATTFGGQPPAGGLTGAVVQALDAADGAGPTTTDGCTAPFTNEAAVAGNIAFIDRGGTCGFVAKTLNAQNAGAIGVIIANNGGGFSNMGGVDPAVTIPAFMVNTADGNTLRANLGALNVTLFNGGDALSTFSSRGPRTGSPIRLKPDIAAPGQNIVSAQTGTTCTGVAPSTGCQTVNATGFLSASQTLLLSGTSMAAPHMAGVMALLRQLHPDWPVEQLKALAMNTATHDVTSLPDANGTRFGSGRVGAGRVDVSSAAQSSVVAFNATEAGAVSVSFETTLVLGTASEVKRIRIVNTGSAPATYDLGIDTVVDAPGMGFSLPGGGAVMVPAHSSVELDVQMDADAAQMRHAREASVAATQTAVGTLAPGAGTQNRHWITEETGYVTFSQGANLKLRVPLYATSRPASAMSAASAIVTGGAPAGSTTLPLAGSSVCTGTLSAGPTCTGTFNAAPFDIASLVTPVQLQAVSPRDATIPAFADIQYGGVAFDAANNKMMFGVSMWGPWATPSDVSVNVYIDANNDGTWDAILFDGNTGTHGSYLFGNQTDPQDTFINLRLNTSTNGVGIPTIATGRYVNGDPGVKDSALFNSSVRVLSAAPSTLLITGPFHYKLVTCPGTLLLCKQFNAFQYDEVTGPLPTGFAFDTANQGLNFSGASLAQDLNGGTLPVTFNTGNLFTQASPGALLLHHHNGAGAQAELVPMEGTVTTDLSIAMTSAPPSPSRGTNVTLTVNASNLGANDASGTVATVELPSGLTYVSDDSGGSFSPGSGQWTIGALASGATAALQIVATVATTDPQIVAAFVSAPAPLETVLVNNRASVNVLAPRDADLAVTAVAGAPSVMAGTPVTFTVTVTNIGDDPAFNVVVGEAFTAGTAAFGSGTPSAGTYNSTTGTWTLSTLGTGVTQTLTFSVTPLGGPTLTTMATGSSSIGDLVLANNTASASTTILTRSTSTAPSIAASVTAGQLTPIIVVVTDVEASGTKTNPAGSVTIGSSILADTITGSCVLAAVPATTDQSSCQVDAQFDSAGPRTITATYAGSTVHTTSTNSTSSTATCSVAATPSPLSFGASGGPGSAIVATASGCNWASSSDAAFLAVTGGATGAGNGTVTYQVAANPQGVSRSATLTIAGQPFTVTQAAATCTYALNPTSASFASAGGTGSVTVTTLVGCPVTAVSNSSFLQVTNIGSGPIAAVDYSVAANPPPGGARSGTITISGQTFTVNESAVAGITLNRSSLTFGGINNGGALTIATSAQPVTLLAGAGDPVAWTVTADQPWLQITPAAGTGTATFSVAVINAPGLPASGQVTGTVTVNATLASNVPQTIPVRLNLYSTTGVSQAFGWMDTPIDGTTGVHGGLAVTGWALDDIEVAHVWIYRDPVGAEPAGIPIFIGEALFVPDARPDIEMWVTAAPLNYRAGWGLNVLSNGLPGGGNGPYTLRAYAEDADGHVTALGSRSFSADNATAAVPFGTIDTPIPGETVSGVYASFGWALTPLPRTIPFDGSTISVFIDGVLHGHPSYNHARPDILAVFPGLNNSAGPVGAFVFDSRLLTNGLHSMVWVARDDSGAQQGLGSRFFRVQNSGGGSAVTESAAAAAVEREPTAQPSALAAGQVGVRHGFDDDAPIRLVRAIDDVGYVAVRVLERIEIHVGGNDEPVTGHYLVGAERRDLPIASTLDKERGVFYWQPAFIGRYELVFVRGGTETRVVVDVR